ncbi:hypothetical protein F5883DRAFT_581547 [Diaporthe sp. PMI_573]|nr:hypothetical protein F5883DRAFT_581547 [Diaporthaceae sp. PMI_573]
MQGGATIKSLVKFRCQIRALVRSSTSPATDALKKLGVEVVVGSFDDIPSLERAMDGVSAVFLNVSPSFEDPKAEIRHANNVITVATRAGSSVQTIVHSTTILTGQHSTFPGWDTWNDFARQYWLSKAANEERLRTSGIPNWTILRPCTFMSNYLQPLAPFFFPELLSQGIQGIFRTALTPETPTMLISPDDVERFAAAALTQPERFHGQEIELGAEALKPPQIIAALSAASGRQIEAQYMPKDEVEKLIPESHIIAAQTYFNERSAQMDAVALQKRWGIQLTSFADFLKKHEEEVRQSFAV